MSLPLIDTNRLVSSEADRIPKNRCMHKQPSVIVSKSDKRKPHEGDLAGVYGVVKVIIKRTSLAWRTLADHWRDANRFAEMV